MCGSRQIGHSPASPKELSQSYGPSDYGITDYADSALNSTAVSWPHHRFPRAARELAPNPLKSATCVTNLSRRSAGGAGSPLSAAGRRNASGRAAVSYLPTP